MQANRAVSPTKMPISPESASKPMAEACKLCQPPLASASVQSSSVANAMRRRLKPMAPSRCVGPTEKVLAVAQQVAASKAMSSGRMKGFVRIKRFPAPAARPPFAGVG